MQVKKQMSVAELIFVSASFLGHVVQGTSLFVLDVSSSETINDNRYHCNVAKATTMTTAMIANDENVRLLLRL